MTRHGGASPPGSHRECIESCFVKKRMEFNMGVNGRSGAIFISPQIAQKGRGHLKHDFCLTAWLLPDWTMTYKVRSDGGVVETDRKYYIYIYMSSFTRLTRILRLYNQELFFFYFFFPR